MFLTDPSDTRPIHLIGIAGAGMSALAELLSARGIRITGSDVNTGGSPDLTRLGITVLPHDPSNVEGARAVIHSSAIPSDHPEMKAARAAGIPLVRRAEALGEAVRDGRVIGIAGTHGKTTTTVMTTEALASAGYNPTGIAGGRVARWDGNLRMGSNLYVVEADEYDRSFLALNVNIAVVLNVEADHLDIYRDLADVQDAFERFASGADTLIRCADDPGAMTLSPSYVRREVRYGVNAEVTPVLISEGDHSRLSAIRVTTGPGGTSFGVTLDGRELGDVKLRVPGVHNVRNALAAIGAGLALDAPFDGLAQGLATFTGVERRFQHIGDARGITIIDDYAHHPTEISATIAAARVTFPERRLVVAFQPHLYSRTRDLGREFAAALAASDALFLCDIYPAREQPLPGVSSDLIAHGLPPRTLHWKGPVRDLVPALLTELREGDVTITMGAGDITRAAPVLLQQLRG